MALERTASTADRLHARVRLHNRTAVRITSVTLLLTLTSEPGTTAPRALRKLETVAVVLPPDGTEDVDLTGAPLTVLATLFGDTSPTAALSLEGVAFETGESWRVGAAPLPMLGTPIGQPTPACVDDAWVVHPVGDTLVAGGLSCLCAPGGRLEWSR